MRKIKLLFRILLTIFLFLNIGKAFAAAPDIAIGSISAFPGQTISVPVTADFDKGYISAQFKLKYDPNLLTPTAVNPGTDNSSWAVVSNFSSPGLINIGMYNTASITGNAKKIAMVNFTVNTTPGTPTLTAPNLQLSNVIFDQVNVTTITNGNFTIPYGDVNADGTITAADAALVAQEVVGLATFSAAQMSAADVSKDGTVTMYDAALIAQFAIGVITHF